MIGENRGKAESIPISSEPRPKLEGWTTRSSNMPTIKEEAKELIESLPDDATFDDVHYHLLVREKIDQGLADVEAGRIVTEQEMDLRFKKWLEE